MARKTVHHVDDLKDTLKRGEMIESKKRVGAHTRAGVRKLFRSIRPGSFFAVYSCRGTASNRYSRRATGKLLPCLGFGGAVFVKADSQRNHGDSRLAGRPRCSSGNGRAVAVRAPNPVSILGPAPT